MRLQCFLLALNTVLFLQAPTSAQVNQRQAAFVDGLIKRYDTNSDGMLDGDERTRISRSVKLVDANGDGLVDRQEAIDSIAGNARKDKFPAIDGVFDEWTEEHIVARDPVGDATGAFDLVSVSARRYGTKLYLSLQFKEGTALNLQSGPDLDGTLRIDLDFGKQGTLIIDFRGRVANLTNGDTITPVPWSSIDFASLPTYANDRFEMVINLNELGVTLPQGLVRLNFSGSDVLDNDVLIGLDTKRIMSKSRQSSYVDAVFRRCDVDKNGGLDDEEMKEARRLPLEDQDGDGQISWHEAFSSLFGGSLFFDRADGTTLRIANLNTLRSGLADGKRGLAINRLLNAAKADVYCFQEEWNESLFQQAALTTFGGKVNSLWAGGCAIVSQWELESIPMTLDRSVAGLVTLPEGQKVAVISAHFKCCGYTGSSEDDLRIQQAEQLISEIKRMREGAFGEKAKNAPVIVVGDYHLVGARTPLDKFKQAGLADLLLRNPWDRSSYTWRGLELDESFWPGRLDLLTHTADLEPLRGLVLDTERIPRPQLRKLGLEKDDSRASDHLMVIGDFRLVPGESAFKLEIPEGPLNTAESRTQEVAEVDLLMSSEEVPKQFRWKDTDDSLTRLQKQRVVLLLKASEAKRKRFQEGSGHVTPYLELQIQVANAIVELDIPDEEKVDALASALDVAREIEQTARMRFNAGLGPPDEWFEAAASRIEVEIRIERWKQSK